MSEKKACGLLLGQPFLQMQNDKGSYDISKNDTHVFNMQ